jgi:cell wall-associated NlpC family hydrolase
MRRGLALLLFGLLAAGLGVASARADGGGTAPTTTGTTTTAATTTTPAPSYAPLPNSSLPAGCVGAGAAAVVPPSHSVVAIGTPASNLGPSGYPSSASVVAFGSSAASGSTCTSAHVSLAAVSLFGGAVTAASVVATDGKGAVTGLEIDGAAVAAAAGQTVAVESWGQLTLGATVGRLRAPLVLRLLQAHGGLLAGTTIAVAFAAAPLPAAAPAAKQRSSSSAGSDRAAAAGSQGQAKDSSAKSTRGQSGKPAPDFPASSDPLRLGGALAKTAKDNPVVSIAMQYLGVPYLWGGASPKTGFDCSGLVMFVFARLGVALPHYAAAQYRSPDTVWVSPKRLHPGDLVFFVGSDGTRKEPGHVGIYVGDGYLIDAPHTGAFVEIDRLDARWFANQYVGARRVVARLHDTRRLLDASKPDPSSADILTRFFPQQVALGTPLRPAAPLSAAAFRSASSDYPLWMVSPLGVVLILLVAGGFFFQRRRQPRP